MYCNCRKCYTIGKLPCGHPSCYITYSFFHPRLVHFRPGHEQRPGVVLTDWRTGPVHRTPTRNILRYLFANRRQADASPLGLSKLPYELWDVIFKHFCGRELCAVRLVSTEWECASRVFFARQFLQQIIVWNTGHHLTRLEQLATKFGPYLRNIHMVPSRFTPRGLLHAFKMYRLRRSTALSGKQTSMSRGTGGHTQMGLISETQSIYLGWWAVGKEWRLLHNDSRSVKFFLSFAENVVSQTCMTANETSKRLTRLLYLYPNSHMSVLTMNFSPEDLGVNLVTSGRAAPEWAFELCVFCDGGKTLRDGAYERKLQESVALATAERTRALHP